jgi:hypothetical protein
VDSIDTQNWIIVAAILAILVFVSAQWLYSVKRRSPELKQRADEVDEGTTDVLARRRITESDPNVRQVPRDRLDTRALTRTEAARFTQSWKMLEGRFVDEPREIVGEADDLVRELMRKRGYLIGDFNRRAADHSVDHASVVDHYRHAQSIALRNERGAADTEELRSAVIEYRVLFDSLLGLREIRSIASTSNRFAVYS